MCGGTSPSGSSADLMIGLSPRVRGNHPARRFPPFRLGSIPACAGEPCANLFRGNYYKVYPRVCGGTRKTLVWASKGHGLSPRVRGNRVQFLNCGGAIGSIPACAGEPARPRPVHWYGRVYPRVCGGTYTIRRLKVIAWGLSPRVRGNPGLFAAYYCISRSIPACAGEPHRRFRNTRMAKVYPRVCGGTSASVFLAILYSGLSPRVRGNHHRARLRRIPVRSIPACAGEPDRPPTPPISTRVYPRVCGGTISGDRVVGILAGLSPRVRGNRNIWKMRGCARRSIPACAGEPSVKAPAPSPTSVYPRVCGGTSCSSSKNFSGDGLSPRVRGNPIVLHFTINKRGSIPACAGEPWSVALLSRWREVYPRVCGGTKCACGWLGAAWGLSPRVRGNRGLSLIHGMPTRSIPACAGEPLSVCFSSAENEVYPRVCGGTQFFFALFIIRQGLSPRVRGNLGHCRTDSGDLRSIPACAGEPQAASGGRPKETVYPRVCGGTSLSRLCVS